MKLRPEEITSILRERIENFDTESNLAEVDPDVLGGIVLRVGNSILDASIRNRLEQLRKQVARG